MQRDKYKIAFKVISFISIIHTTCPSIVIVQELRMFVMLPYCI